MARSILRYAVTICMKRMDVEGAAFDEEAPVLGRREEAQV